MRLQDQRELDAMVQRYQEEQWAKYDAKQKALADARASLAAEVAQVHVLLVPLFHVAPMEVQDSGNNAVPANCIARLQRAQKMLQTLRVHCSLYI